MDESHTLDEELRNIAEDAKGLRGSLDVHGRWQRLHDTIEVLQGFQHTSHYRVRYEVFFHQEHERMERLVCETIAYSNSMPIKREQLNGDLEALRDALSVWKQASDMEIFDDVRAKFDEAFFRIDKVTLEAVDRSSKRVKAFREVLRKLHGSQQRMDAM